ncbi:hypothetical protein ANO14919_032730 [Xylariales sp. No.14919]|nr:hypothetical protein ANO14919_032730 [Xylariales sp. No.14919]
MPALSSAELTAAGTPRTGQVSQKHNLGQRCHPHWKLRTYAIQVQE